MPTLLLVDGSSYLYRAFHALPDLRNSQGEPTGAIRGVLSMLRRLESDYKAEFRACVFDAKGKTFRDDWYPEYKAQRPPMPDDLRAQIAPLHEAVQAEGWPLLSVEGVEADDVIGTLTRQALERGWEVVISTGDKDLTQLVRPGVQWVNTMSEEVLDPAGVEAKFGVPPERIVDYLALVGDTVDNVPGVEKCGPKTALKWLAEYGDLDTLIANADKVGGKVGENLRRHLDFLPLGRRLVTVATDVELPVAVDELPARGDDKAALRALYERFEFRSWLKDLDAGAASVAESKAATDARRFAPDEDGKGTEPADPGAHRGNYAAILDWPAFDAWLDRITASGLTAFDTETTSLDPMAAQLVGMSFAVETGEAAYLPLAHRGAEAPGQLPLAEVLDKLRPWLESDAHAKLGQNLKYDAHVLANHGIALRGIAHDTLLESYVLESDRPHDMDSLAKRHLGLTTIPYTEVCGKGAKQIGFDEVAVERATEYAAEDADVTLRLHRHLWPRLEAEPALAALYRDIELPVLSVLQQMERNGVLIDPFLLSQHSEELGRRLHALELQAHELAGQPFNLGSPKQLGEILFGKLGLPVVKKTATGQPSTDEEVLEKLADDYPLPKLLLEHRSLAKLKSTYADKLPRMVNPRTGRVHTSFSQATAVTGRLSSSEPNLQNIPIRTPEGRRIRAAFIAPRGHLIVSADYSQVELRIMAHLSGDARLLEAFARGEDVHRATAGEVFGVPPAEVSSEQRRYAKVINFGLIYGMSAHGLAKNLGIERAAAQGWIDRYFARYPGVADYMERTRVEARDKGYVETVFGRRLYLPDIRAAQVGRRQAAERAAINAPMQGTAADLIKKAMIATRDWLAETGLQSKLVLQVHDELVLEAPEAELETIRAELPRLMGGVAQLRVPLLVEVGAGDNWDEAH
ncbi:DNA polymerase I [Thauera linaloolentis]|uniref:DNA polymerase I n=1 Tax=Thauera linaloolentis (strain DSM 12138 / JCM 21573 / CCUG 41526 / CIP 105981 / IAM 15112 / NBRC 102519 / 47Lol) TaxID=1123367 RepID=N6YEG2_THAL4|nr:DNA polymerase I [Thauera linaloolentis]ENO89885.1 DNA polymerase I [Thauera linaloolentis 47Lol = DSM 12138]MCM8564568.1 DNA polymerase I [Thauera linaloolentis]